MVEFIEHSKFIPVGQLSERLDELREETEQFSTAAARSIDATPYSNSAKEGALSELLELRRQAQPGTFFLEVMNSAHLMRAGTVDSSLRMHADHITMQCLPQIGSDRPCRWQRHVADFARSHEYGVRFGYEWLAGPTASAWLQTTRLPSLRPVSNEDPQTYARMVADSDARMLGILRKSRIPIALLELSDEEGLAVCGNLLGRAAAGGGIASTSELIWGVAYLKNVQTDEERVELCRTLIQYFGGIDRVQRSTMLKGAIRDLLPVSARKPSVSSGDHVDIDTGDYL